MIRTVLIQAGVVAAACVSDAPLTEAERRAWLLGPDANQDVDLPPGELVEIRGATAEWPIGAGWRQAGSVFEAPPAAPRVITAAEFVACFTPSETAALMQIPETQQAALLATAQGSVNLDSAQLVGLMKLAVAKGALTSARAEAVQRGEPAPG
jgi:hypothetical protein